MIQKTIDVDKPMRIVIVSDWHIGHAGFRPDIAEDIVKEISEDNTYFIIAGDAIEGREPGHKFYNADENTMTVGEQYDTFFKYIRPYTDKCLGMVLGNHEMSLVQKTTINPLQQFANDNEITYGGTTLRLILKNKNRHISMIVNHGAGGGNAGASLNKAIGFGKTFNADIVVLGHFHRLVHAEELKSYEDSEGRIRWKPMTVVLNGCTIEGCQDESFGSYVERKCLPPVALGYAILNIDKNLNKTVELKSY